MDVDYLMRTVFVEVVQYIVYFAHVCTIFCTLCMDVDYLMRTVFVEVVQPILHIVYGC